MDLAKLGVKVDPKEGVSGLKKITDGLEAVGDSAEKNLGKLDKESTKAQKSISKTGNRLRDAKGRFTSAGKGAEGLANKISGTNRGIDSLVQKTGRLVPGLRGITSGAGAAGGALKGAAGGATALTAGIVAATGAVVAIIAVIGTLTAAVAGLWALFRKGSPIAAEFERADVALNALTGSIEETNMVTKSMKDLWKSTGVTIGNQARNIQKFIALGFSSRDAVKLNKNILDVAGSVGLSASEASLLGSALAQVKAKGVVSMEELRQQIAEKGIPVIEELQRKLGVTGQAFFQMIQKGEVPAQELIDLFLNMEGSFDRFRGGAERMGKTWDGIMARMNASWSLLASEFAKPIQDALKPVLEELIQLINFLVPYAKQLGQSIANAIKALYQIAKDDGAAGLIEFVELGLKVAAIKFGRFLITYGVAAANTLSRAMTEALIEASIKFGKSLITQVTKPLRMLEKGIQKTAEILSDPKKLAQKAGDSLFGFLNPGVAKQAGLQTATQRIGDGKVDLAGIFRDELKKSQGFADALGISGETDLEKQFSKRFNDAVSRFNELNPQQEFAGQGKRPTLPNDGNGVGSSGGSAGSGEKIQKQVTETQRLADAWGDVDAQIDHLVSGSLMSLADGIGNAIEGLASGALSAKDAFAQMATSIIGDITRMIIKMTIQLALQRALGGFATGLVGGATGAAGGALTQSVTAAVAHTGGGVGNGGRNVPSGAFASARRLHGGGLASSEEPAILEKGEAVLSRSDRKEMERRLGDDDGASNQQQQSVQILNVIDPQEVQRQIAANPDIIINAIGQNRKLVKALIR